jgi:hypothetical protein
MKDFLHSIVVFWKEAAFQSWQFWIWPVGTLLLIYLLTVISSKMLKYPAPFKTTFKIFSSLINSALVVSTIIIAVICYEWTKNYFSDHHYELALLLSLVIGLLVAVIGFYNLSRYYTQNRLKHLVGLPLTPLTEGNWLLQAKKAFRRLHFRFLFPILGFLLLLFVLNEPTNLIHIVYDNSTSMKSLNAINALSATFDKLSPNNKIILTTLEIEGGNEAEKHSMKGIMSTDNSGALKAGRITMFNTPAEAKNGLNQLSESPTGSPICESIWKTYLFSKEIKDADQYDNKVLIVITDGEDDLIQSLAQGKFFFDDDQFTAFFPPERIFIINYLSSGSNSFFDRFQQQNVDVAPATNENDYLDALNNALGKYKQNWNLIFWTILIYAIAALSTLFIQPQRTD